MSRLHRPRIELKRKPCVAPVDCVFFPENCCTADMTHRCVCKVVSFEAPVVVVAAEDDGAKLDPTRKVVVYGSVEAQASGSYTLQWNQVRYAWPSSFDPPHSNRSEKMCVILVSPRRFYSTYNASFIIQIAWSAPNVTWRAQWS